MPPVIQQPLGLSLKNAREAMGQSIEEVLRITHLPRAAVLALETEDMGYFASPLYARSFLKQYGEYLGLDVSPWLEALIPTSLIDEHAADSYVQDISSGAMSMKWKRNNENQVSGHGVGGKFASLLLISITGLMVWLGIELYEGDSPASKGIVVPSAEEKARVSEEGQKISERAE